MRSARTQLIELLGVADSIGCAGACVSGLRLERVGDADDAGQCRRCLLQVRGSRHPPSTRVPGPETAAAAAVAAARAGLGASSFNPCGGGTSGRFEWHPSRTGSRSY